MKTYRIKTSIYLEAENQQEALNDFYACMEAYKIEVNKQYTTIDDPNCCGGGCCSSQEG